MKTHKYCVQFLSGGSQYTIQGRLQHLQLLVTVEVWHPDCFKVSKVVVFLWISTLSAQDTKINNKSTNIKVLGALQVFETETIWQKVIGSVKLHLRKASGYLANLDLQEREGKYMIENLSQVS